MEHDGSLYSCDHYVYPEYKLGNIMETSSSRMVFSEEQRKFGMAKFNSLPRQCLDCAYLFACNGECPKNRLIRTRDGEAGTKLPVQRTSEILETYRSRRERHLQATGTRRGVAPHIGSKPGRASSYL